MTNIHEFIVYFSIAFVLFCMYVYYTNKNGDMVYVPAKEDGNQYLVRNLPDKEAAADLLARLRKKMVKLVDYLQTIKDEQNAFCTVALEQLKRRFNPDKMSESPADSEHTSFSVNKGMKIFFCIRNKSDGTFIDENTVMYVSIHECSHLATDEIGHTDSFWNNFRFLLRAAIKSGVYQYQDFVKSPVPYCGIMINSSPYDPSNDNFDSSSKNVLSKLRSCS